MFALFMLFSVFTTLFLFFSLPLRDVLGLLVTVSFGYMAPLVCLSIHMLLFLMVVGPFFQRVYFNNCLDVLDNFWQVPCSLSVAAPI